MSLVINFVLVVLVFSMEMPIILRIGFLSIIIHFVISPQLSHQHHTRASQILLFSLWLCEYLNGNLREPGLRKKAESATILNPHCVGLV